MLIVKYLLKPVECSCFNVSSIDKQSKSVDTLV